MRFPLVSSFIIQSQSVRYVMLCYVIMIKQRDSKKHEEEKPCDMVIMPKTLDAHSHQRDFVC